MVLLSWHVDVDTVDGFLKFKSWISENYIQGEKKMLTYVVVCVSILTYTYVSIPLMLYHSTAN